MPIAEIPKQVRTGAQDEVHGLAERVHAQDRPWPRILAAGTLFTGAMLLATGRRKAAVAIATAGTVIALLEESDGVAAAWAALPEYIQAGKHFLGRLEGFVEDVSIQGQRVRSLVDRLPR